MLSFLSCSHLRRFHSSYEKAKADLGKGLELLNNHLLDKTYLVNHQITLADIVVASTLLYPFKLVADKNYLKPYGNVVRWFQTCVNQPEFQQVVGQVAMCKTELLAPGQDGPAKGGDAKQGGGKKEKKKEGKKEVKKEEKPAEPAPPKKVRTTLTRSWTRTNLRRSPWMPGRRSTPTQKRMKRL